MTNNVGIDAIGFQAAECYVDMAELAEARDVEPAKYLKGIGQTQMAVATPCEDTVTLAVGAARRAMETFDVDPQEIGTLIVGTETGVDHSKPVAVYLHELLGLSTRCRTFETKHACYGAMAGLTSATDWIVSGRARGRKALIIASDIARYGICTPGEPTQGAGAVAMVVAERPRLVRLHHETFGDYTRQVMDFWRPLYSKYAFADGHYSIECYLEALQGAWEDARSQADDPTARALEKLGACFYHVPFTKMAKKAHVKHWELEVGRALEEADAPTFAESYDARVLPWLSLNAIVGNIYTGSLFLSLNDYLRSTEGCAEGDAVSFFSYGSGCGAAYCTGQIVDGARDWSARIDPAPVLAARRRLAVPEYESVLAACEAADMNGQTQLDPAAWNLEGSLFYVGTRDHVRQYAQGVATGF